MADVVSNHRSFGLVMLVLGLALLGFIATGALSSAPLIVMFGGLGGLGAAILGIWALIGKF